MNHCKQTSPLGIINLTQFSLIQVTGHDACSFLQGQLTCDLELLDNSRAMLGAYCDRKGRMLCNFHLFKHNDSYCLCLPRNMIELTITTLNKYAMFSKLNIEANHAYALIGLAAPQTQHCDTPDVIANIELPGSANHKILVYPPQDHQSAWNELSANHPQLTSNQWNLLNIDAKLGYIQPATSGQFLPQMLNWEMLGGISFDKGCYIGQEIVARSKHRGQVKKRVHILSVISEKPLGPGDKISQPQPGIVVTSAKTATDWKVLAVIRE